MVTVGFNPYFTPFFSPISFVYLNWFLVVSSKKFRIFLLAGESDPAFKSLVQGAPSMLGPRTVSNMSKSLVGDLKQGELVSRFFELALVV